MLAATESVARIGSWHWRPGEDSAAFSDELRRLLGVGPDDPMSLDVVRRLAAPEDRRRLEAAVRALLQDGVPLDQRVHGHRPSGEEVVLHHRAQAERDAGGEVVRLHGTVQDVTDEAVRARRLQRIAQAGVELAAASSPGEVLDVVARAARDVTGAREARARPVTGQPVEPVRRPAAIVLPLTGRDGAALGVLETLGPAGPGFAEEDERRVEHLAHLAAGALERLELEGRLARARRIEALSRLAAGIVHDFNNTLGVMLVRSELLAAATDDPEVAGHAAELHAAARDAADVARDLLALSRSDEAPEQRPAPEPVDARDVLRDVARRTAPLLPEAVELVVDAGDVPLPTHLGATDLRQALTNLVLNARDAVEGGGCIELTGAVERDEVVLRVCDDGHGMAPETRARVFEPYFTTKAERGGTGLGLPGVHTTVTRAGGRVDVESAPGHGTVFSLRLPHPGFPHAIVPSAGGRALPGGDEPVAVAGRNRAVVAMLEALLASLGYAVTATTSPGPADLAGAALVVHETTDPDGPPPPGAPRDAALVRLVPSSAPADPGRPDVLRRPVSADRLARAVRTLLDDGTRTGRGSRTGPRRRPADVHPSALDE